MSKLYSYFKYFCFVFSGLGFCGLPIELFLYFYKHVYIEDQNFPFFGHINFLQSESFCPMLPPYAKAFVLVMVALFQYSPSLMTTYQYDIDVLWQNNDKVCKSTSIFNKSSLHLSLSCLPSHELLHLQYETIMIVDKILTPISFQCKSCHYLFQLHYTFLQLHMCTMKCLPHLVVFLLCCNVFIHTTYTITNTITTKVVILHNHLCHYINHVSKQLHFCIMEFM